MSSLIEGCAKGCEPQIKYFDFPFHWPDCLTQQISGGYPAFLWVCHWVTPHFECLYWVSLLILALALWVFGVMLRRKGFDHGSIGACLIGLSVTPLLRPWLSWRWSPCTFAYPERITVPLTIMAIGACLLEWHWLAAGAVFVAYMMRPSLLFLIPLGFILKPTKKMALAMLLPFLAFSAIRKVAIGEFGIASMGSFQSSGIYDTLFTESDANKLSAEFRPLAREILKKRPPFEPLSLDRLAEHRYRWNWLYGDLVLIQVINPYTEAHFKNPAQANAFLSRMWWEVARLRWRERLDMYYRAWVIGFVKFPDPWLYMGLMVCLVALLAYRRSPTSYVECLFLLKIHFLYFMLSSGMLFLVQYPHDRYMQANFLFLPCVLLTGIWCCIRDYFWKNWRVL